MTFCERNAPIKATNRYTWGIPKSGQRSVSLACPDTGPNYSFSVCSTCQMDSSSSTLVVAWWSWGVVLALLWVGVCFSCVRHWYPRHARRCHQVCGTPLHHKSWQRNHPISPTPRWWIHSFPVWSTHADAKKGPVLQASGLLGFTQIGIHFIPCRSYFPTAV